MPPWSSFSNIDHPLPMVLLLWPTSSIVRNRHTLALNRASRCSTPVADRSDNGVPVNDQSRKFAVNLMRRIPRKDEDKVRPPSLLLPLLACFSPLRQPTLLFPKPCRRVSLSLPPFAKSCLSHTNTTWCRQLLRGRPSSRQQKRSTRSKRFPHHNQNPSMDIMHPSRLKPDTGKALEAFSCCGWGSAEPTQQQPRHHTSPGLLIPSLMLTR